MKLSEVAAILEAEVLAGEESLSREAGSVFGSDMMSEVLAFSKEKAMLLTGLCNPQVIRTAELIDVECIVFIRGKRPTEEMLEKAREDGIVVIASKFGMYHSCGKLYAAGLQDGCK